VDADDIGRSVARVLNQGDDAVGTAFFIAPRLLVTCTHVLRDMGLIGPLDDTLVRLEVLTSPRQKVTARVAEWREADEEDLAFLDLVGAEIDGLEAFSLGPSRETMLRAFSAFGFPVQKLVEGMPGVGKIGGRATHNGHDTRLLYEADQITWGFSGGPIFDISARRVVGVAATIIEPDRAGRGSRTAFMIPTETLWRIRPDLHVQPACPYSIKEPFGWTLGPLRPRVSTEDLVTAIRAPARAVGLDYHPSSLPELLAKEVFERVSAPPSSPRRSWFERPGRRTQPLSQSSSDTVDQRALTLVAIVGTCCAKAQVNPFLEMPALSLEHLITEWAEDTLLRTFPAETDRALAGRALAALFSANEPRPLVLDLENVEEAVDHTDGKKVVGGLVREQLLVEAEKSDGSWGITVVDPALVQKWQRVRRIIDGEAAARARWLYVCAGVGLFGLLAGAVSFAIYAEIQSDLLRTERSRAQANGRRAAAQVLLGEGTPTWAADVLSQQDVPPLGQELSWVNLGMEALHAGSVRLLPHAEPVIGVSISADGSLVATLGQSGVARVWRGFAPTESATRSGDEGPLFQERGFSLVRFGPDGRLWTTRSDVGGGAEPLLAWPVSAAGAGLPVGYGPRAKRVEDVLFAPNGKLIVARAGAGEERHLFRVDGARSPMLEECIVKKRNSSLSVLADTLDISNEGVVAVCKDDSVRFQGLDGRKTKMGKLDAAPEFVRCVDGASIVVAAGDAMYLWDAKDGSSPRKLGIVKNPRNIASPNGRPFVVVADGDDALKLVSLSPSAQPPTVTDVSDPFSVSLVALEHIDGGLVILGTDGGVWHVNEPAPHKKTLIRSLFRPRAEDAVSGAGRGGAVSERQLSVSDDRKTFAVGSDDRIVRAWSRDALLDAAVIGLPDTAGNQDCSVSVAIVPAPADSKRDEIEIVTAPARAASGRLRRWSVKSSAGNSGSYSVTELKGSGPAAPSRVLKSMSRGGAVWERAPDDGGARTAWGLLNGGAEVTIAQPVSAGAVHPDGHCAVGIEAQGQLLCSTAAGAARCAVTESAAGLQQPLLAWSSDGARLFLADGHSVANVFTSKGVCQLEASKRSVSITDSIWDLSVDATGRRAAILTSGHEVLLWYPEDPARQLVEVGHRLQASAAAFSPNGNWLAVAAAPHGDSGNRGEGEVTLWEPDKPDRPAVSLRGDCEFVSVDISENRQWAVAGCRDGTARAWDLAWSSIQAKLKSDAARSRMPESEWMRRLGEKP
jgi:hypothetical protein